MPYTVTREGVRLGDGRLLSWGDLAEVFEALKTATDGKGRIQGVKCNYSRYLRNHWVENRCIFGLLSMDNPAPEGVTR